MLKNKYYKTLGRVVVLFCAFYSMSGIASNHAADQERSKRQLIELSIREEFIKQNTLELSSKYLNEQAFLVSELLADHEALQKIQKKLSEHQRRQVKSLTRRFILRKASVGAGTAVATLSGLYWWIYSAPKSYVKTRKHGSVNAVEKPSLKDKISATAYAPIHKALYQEASSDEKKQQLQLDVIQAPTRALNYSPSQQQTHLDSTQQKYEYHYKPLSYGLPEVAGAFINKMIYSGGVYFGLPMAKNAALDALGYGSLAFSTPNIKCIEEQARYAALRPFISADLKEFVDGLFTLYWRDASSANLLKLKTILDTMVKLPLGSKKLDPKDFDEKDLLEQLRDYKDPVAKKFLSLGRKIIRRNKLDVHGRVSQFAAYLLGEAGVGKTNAANILAAKMKTSFVRLNFDGASVEDIVGTDFSTDQAKPGRILEALMAASETTSERKVYSNSIIFIDEFDKLFMKSNSEDTLAFVLKLLDPDNLKFYSPYLHAEVDLSKATFILAGNYEIKEPALRDRLDIFPFLGYTVVAKKRIALEVMAPELVRYYQLSEDVIDERFIQSVEQFLQSDSSKGLRSVKKYVQRLVESEAF